MEHMVVRTSRDKGSGRTEDARLRSNRQTAFQCGPVLLGVKPSNLLIIEAQYAVTARQLLKGSGVEVRSLFYRPGQKIILLVYRKDLLEEVLEPEENRAFLRGAGYQDKDLPQILEGLQERYRQYMEHKEGFPHELGLLLGYPLEDVKGFILHKGEGFLCSGYWKVYGDVKKAQQTFRLYDTVRKGLADLTEKGLDLLEAVEYWERSRAVEGQQTVQAAG